MKVIRETQLQTVTQGILGPREVRLTRVRKLADKEDVPDGAELVSDKTELHDWTPEVK